MAVCDQGVAMCFGCNAQGQLGLSRPDGSKPLPPLSKSSGGPSAAQHAKLWSLPSELHLPGIFVAEASCGGMHTLLRSREGLLYSFGEGRNGRLGHGETKSCSIPAHESAL